MQDFIAETVLKRDVFSETQKGRLTASGEAAIRRVVSASPLWSRPLAWVLARHEISTLRALDGVPGTPRLHGVDRDGLCRSWTEGAPLHLARPAAAGWYRDAHRLLRELRRRGVTHNDLAKPQNWLMTPDGRAALIDFQLAKKHRVRGPLFRVMAYEDFRHLLKQKKAFAPHLMTPTARRLLARRSLPSRIWRASGKKVYNWITRGVFRWSDGEGTRDRLDREGPGIVAALKRTPGVGEVALVTFPLPSKGVGIYAFVEAASEVAAPPGADLIQRVDRLPRRTDGEVRRDWLQAIAMNQMTDIERTLSDDAADPALRAIADGRLNFSDRRLSRQERPG